MKSKEKDYVAYIRHFVGITFTIIIFLTIIQVFFRFALNKPIVWSEALVRFLLVWMTMIGACVLSYDDKHLKITSLVEKFPMKLKFVVHSIIKVLILTFLLMTMFSSYSLIKVSNTNTMGTLNIPMSYWRMAAPVGCGFIFVYEVVRYIKEFKLFKAGEYGINDRKYDV